MFICCFDYSGKKSGILIDPSLDVLKMFKSKSAIK